MNKTILVALLATATVLPLAHADETLGYDGFLAPTETGYLATQTDRFFLPIHAGDVIHAELTWYDSSADLDLRLTAPGGSCTLIDPANPPGTDVNCLAASAMGRVNNGVPTCTYDSNAPFVGGQLHESFTKTATFAGMWEVDAEAAWVNTQVTGGAAYHLEVYVNGDQVDMSGAAPSQTNLVHSGDLVCHAQLP